MINRLPERINSLYSPLSESVFPLFVLIFAFLLFLPVTGVFAGTDYIYSGGRDDTVRKIDSSGNEVWSFTGHSDRVEGVAVDSDGYVYSASWDETVRKIDPSGNEVWTFDGHTSQVRAVAVDSDGYVYSASFDETVRKIDPSGNEVWSFDDHTAAINEVAVDSDGYVYSVSDTWDNTLKKIDPSGNEVWTFDGGSSAVWGVAVDSDGYVYAGFGDHTVRKIDSSGNEVWSFTYDSSVRDVAVDSDGYVYAGSYDNTVRKIDSSGNEVWTFTGHNDSVLGVAVDSDGYVYSGSFDETVRKIDSSGNEVWSFTGHNDRVEGVAVAPDDVAPDEATTLPPDNIETTSARLRGEWDLSAHDAEATSIHWELWIDGSVYWYSDSYLTDGQAGSAALTVSGLDPDTTFGSRFAVYSEELDQTFHGDVLDFTTLSVDPLDPPEEIPDAVDWGDYYDNNSDDEFDEPLAFADTIAGVFDTILGGLANRIEPFVGRIDLEDVYLSGSDTGTFVPLAVAYMDELNGFMGGLPVSRVFIVFLIVQIFVAGVAAVRAIVSIIPFV